MATRSGAAAAAAGALLAMATSAAGVGVCPGESARYGDHKCDHDQTHRVCATLLDGQGAPLAWGSKGDFWQITGQKAFQWDDQIRENGGDSWCICMWATARLISMVGCENVHINCAATDVAYVEGNYEDGGVDLHPANECLKKKCPSGIAPMQKAAIDEAPAAAAGAAPALPRAAVAAALVAGVAAAAAVAARRLTSGAKPKGRGAEDGFVE